MLVRNHRRTPTSKLMRLRLSSLDPTVSKVKLQELFEEYGEVVTIKVLRSAPEAPPSLAFVEMRKEREAKEAMAAINGTVIGKTTLVVETSNETVRTARTTPLPIEEEEDDLLDDPYEDDEPEEGKIKEVSLDEINTDEI